MPAVPMRLCDHGHHGHRWLLCALLIPAAVWAALVVSCADDAQFTTRFAPEYPSAPHATVSVFGVYKDGRMSAETWDYVAPLLSGAAEGGLEPQVDLADAGGGAECAAAYETSLVGKDMPLFTAVDSYARANGVTEGLLEKFAPAAKGDLIMVITISGHVPSPSDAGDNPTMAAPPMGGSGRGGMVGRRGVQGGSMRRVEERNALEMSATLYSKTLHRTVGAVGFAYTGKSADEAMKRFVEKVRSVVPNPCAGWGELHVDEEAIKKIEE
jgi:hypothetical protein